ncbi:MAG TPA: type IV pilus twitching motility protein PilT [Anaerolineales bacterium]|jgi:twitching motility protein PilT
MTLQPLLTWMNEHQASDLHLKLGAPPVFRIHGRLAPQPDGQALTVEALDRMLEEVTTPEQRAAFEQSHELDFSHEVSQQARYRVNVAYQRGSVSLSLRRIDLQVPTLEELALPEVCGQLALKRQGLVLVTGPTGSGKSTTLAAMIEHINQKEARRIVTIEDPIEYIYRDAASLITQREVGRDTQGFAIATRQALRQDPDVILVGEMRDQDTMAACLTAAETGHLVMSTLHTNSGPQTIDRIVDSFPAHQQGQIRMQLSLTLEGVLSQALLTRLDGNGRLPVLEVMLATSAIRNLIREGKTHQMATVIESSRQAGMQTMDQALETLYRRGMVSIDGALAQARDADALQASLARG